MKKWLTIVELICVLRVEEYIPSYFEDSEVAKEDELDEGEIDEVYEMKWLIMTIACLEMKGKLRISK